MLFRSDLIALSGLSPDDIEIVYTGTRPGEKLYEELYFDDEETLRTPHPKLRAAYHRPYSVDEVENCIAELADFVNGPEELLRSKLKEIVAEYESNTPPAPESATDLSASWA